MICRNPNCQVRFAEQDSLEVHGKSIPTSTCPKCGYDWWNRIFRTKTKFKRGSINQPKEREVYLDGHRQDEAPRPMYRLDPMAIEWEAIDNEV